MFVKCGSFLSRSIPRLSLSPRDRVAAAAREIRHHFADSGYKTLNFKKCRTKASACRCTSRGPRTWWPGSSSTRAGPGTRLTAEDSGFTRLRRNRPKKRFIKFSDSTVFIVEVGFYPLEWVVVVSRL